jgi:hypothetical protein
MGLYGLPAKFFMTQVAMIMFMVYSDSPLIAYSYKNSRQKRKYPMLSFVDCPACASEIMVSEQTCGLILRCPDCLEWIGQDYDDVCASKTYYGASMQFFAEPDEYYDE